MKYQLQILLFSLIVLLSACVTEPSSSIEIRYDGKQIPFIERSAHHTVQQALFSGSDAEEANHALRWITILNYDPEDGADPQSDPLTEPGQVKIFLSLHDEAGTTPTSPIKPGIYKGSKTAGPMSFELVNVHMFRDGKEERLYLYPAQLAEPATCEVRINNVDGGTVAGEINAVGKHDGKEFIIRGPFNAKINK